MKTLLPIIVALTLVWVACNSHTPQDKEKIFDGDSGLIELEDGQTNYDSSEQSGGDNFPRPPEGSILLRIPTEFRLCQSHGEQSFNYKTPKSIITLFSGDVFLSFVQKEYNFELIETTQTNGQEATPAGPGKIRVFCFGETEDVIENCQFGYSKPFQLEALPVEIRFSFWSNVQSTRILEFPKNIQGEYYLCDDLSAYDSGHVTATVDNNDQLEFFYFYFESCALLPPHMGGLCPDYVGNVVQAEFVRDQIQRATGDYFKLGLACQHHGFPFFFYSLFDEPVNDVYGVVLEDSHYSDRVLYLDSNLEISFEANVVSIEYD